MENKETKPKFKLLKFPKQPMANIVPNADPRTILQTMLRDEKDIREIAVVWRNSDMDVMWWGNQKSKEDLLLTLDIGMQSIKKQVPSGPKIG